MTYVTTRVLIWGKTYPEPSAKYLETVCTGGVREDGTPIRLYPVPLRYLPGEQQYSLYDWIEVPVEKSTTDPRPESFRIVSDHIVCVGHVDTDHGSWHRRRDLIFREPAWQFGSVAALKAAQLATRRSMGIVTPGVIEGVRLVEKSRAERDAYFAKIDKVTRQQDIFRPVFKRLAFLTHNVQMTWRCAETCDECSNQPHDMKALDWGLLELARRQGWEKARDRLETLANLDTHEFRIFMGNFRLHPRVFGIIGLWYPTLTGARRPVQQSLF